MDETLSNQLIPRQEIHTPTVENRLEIIDEAVRKKYLSRLNDMDIVPVGEVTPLEDDIISNIRLYHIDEMVYPKGESATDKFTTVYNTLATYNASLFMVIDSDGVDTDFYLGVRNNEADDSSAKRSTVTLGDTLIDTLRGHFPGLKSRKVDRADTARISSAICQQHNMTSVSVVGTQKRDKEESNKDFIQGIEKLVLAMQGRQYTGIIIAQNKSPQAVQMMRTEYQKLYTKLSPWQKVQTSEGESSAQTRSQSFSEMDGKQKAALIGGAAAQLAGIAAGAFVPGAVGQLAGAASGAIGQGAVIGAMVGAQAAGQLSGFINALAPNSQLTEGTNSSVMMTTENKTISDMLKLIDEELQRTDEFDSYGMWNVAGYFISDDMSAAEIAASNYRSLMSGEKTGREVSAINSWRSKNPAKHGDFHDLTTYLSRFRHPQFVYGGDVCVDATTAVSGKELGLHLGLPRSTVPGLPVIEHAEFGKEVHSYRLFPQVESTRPEDRLTLGKVFDLGGVTNSKVELDNRSLNMHTFITGSTGSGKSNTVYQMLNELHQDGVPFLVIEPAKGEYKDVFGNWDDVHVFATNPNVAALLNINPFMFPRSIHVLEHVDGLVEIFSACWPMYDAMPAFFKDAVLKSYEAVGWDLGSSSFDGDVIEYPDFAVLVEQLDVLIDESDYASDIKSNYRGALITRVRSLTVGLNKYIFTTEQTSYEQLFDENCILDISRVKSGETKALIMGLMVYALDEYRMDRHSGSNSGLRHVTVLEEAHNLLKNVAAGGVADVIGKSVEMISNTIAEIRTYGEGFIIVDQSPSSVDLAAIKNTNTKIVLRTPEANDREAVGRSIGLSEDQMNEIAKLPSGVAVVYQNDWISPVLTMIDKAQIEETPYIHSGNVVIRPLRESRTKIIETVMEPWLPHDQIDRDELIQALNSIEVSRAHSVLIAMMIDTYTSHGGHLLWNEDSIPVLHSLLFDIFDLSEPVLLGYASLGNPDVLRRFVRRKTSGLTAQSVEEICSVLTMGVDDES